MRHERFTYNVRVIGRMALPLLGALMAGTSFLQGGGFGLGYGVGVRAGYEDLYPALKQSFLKLAQELKPTQFASGLNLGLQSNN